MSLRFDPPPWAKTLFSVNALLSPILIRALTLRPLTVSILLLVRRSIRFGMPRSTRNPSWT